MSEMMISGLMGSTAAASTMKLADFVGQGADGLHVVLDFDRTITMACDRDTADVTQWLVWQRMLRPEAKRQAQVLYDLYRPIELAHQLTPAQSAAWAGASLALMKQEHLRIPEVVAELVRQARPRPGVREMLDWCTRCGVPVVIISAGMHEVIRGWCTAYGLDVNEIVATRLYLDTDGAVVGWDPATLVHMLNKHEADHVELNRLRREYPRCLLVGDSLGDATMAVGSEPLRLRLLDGGQAQDLRTLEQTFERFDAVITDGTFEPIIELLSQFAA